LEGKVNPWVLLASGELVKQRGAGHVGEDITVNGQKGIVVGRDGMTDGVKPSGYVDELSQMDDAARAAEFKRLEGLAPDVRKAKIGHSGVPRNPKFRSNFFEQLEKAGVALTENAKKFISVHHVAPNFLKGKPALDDFLKKVGHNIDEVENAIGLPRVDLNRIDDACRQLDDLAKQADDLAKAGKQLSPEDLAKQAKSQADLDNAIDKLGLPKGMSPSEMRKVSDELAAFKKSSVHDSYHNAYNSRVEKRIQGFADMLAKHPEKATEIKKAFDTYMQNLRKGLEDGTEIL
jgi:hypothetical protein